jgi:proton-dependent oligopeptide transporter, POT family
MATKNPQEGAVTTDAPPPGLEQWTTDKRFFGHPRGLSTLFFTEMWERFSYYGIRPLITLFVSAAIVDGGFGFDRATAGAIVGIYAFCVYIASLPGGWIADRWLGLRRAIWWGGVFIALGHLFIGLSAAFEKPAFFLGLVFIVIGTGLLKPNISAIVGDLYPEAGSRRDAGFSIFYMGINTGALIAPLVTGLLGERIGWHWGFGAAGVGMLIGLITYRARAEETLGPIGMTPSAGPDEQRRVKTIAIAALVLVFGIVGAAMAGLFTVNAVALAASTTNITLGVVTLYFIYLIGFGANDNDERKRFAVIMVLFVFAVIFWSAFEQAPTSLNLFARDFTDRDLFGWEVPTLWLQSVNSLFVVTLAPVFAAIWMSLGSRGKDLSSPAKFTVGLFFAGLGFLIMIAAARIVTGGDAGQIVKVSMWWLIFSYLFQTIGELSLSPVGLSSMTKLSPRRFVGQMMGVWFTASALGNLVAGRVAGHVDPEKLDQMPELFIRTAGSLFVAAVILGILIIPIRNMMKGSSMSAGH